MEEIQQQIENVQKQHAVQTEYLDKIRSSITKLKAEEQVVIKNIDTLNGALQAYTNTLQLLKEQKEKVE
jgi:septin family protein